MQILLCINNNYLSLIKTKIKLLKSDTYRQNSVFCSPEFYFCSAVVIKNYFSSWKKAITSKPQHKYLIFFFPKPKEENLDWVSNTRIISVPKHIINIYNKYKKCLLNIGSKFQRTAELQVLSIIFLRNTFMKCLKWHLTMSHLCGKAGMHNKGMKIKF